MVPATSLAVPLVGKRTQLVVEIVSNEYRNCQVRSVIVNLRSCKASGPDYGIGTVGKCLGPTTSKGSNGRWLQNILNIANQSLALCRFYVGSTSPTHRCSMLFRPRAAGRAAARCPYVDPTSARCHQLVSRIVESLHLACRFIHQFVTYACLFAWCLTEFSAQIGDIMPYSSIPTHHLYIIHSHPPLPPPPPQKKCPILFHHRRYRCQSTFNELTNSRN